MAPTTRNQDIKRKKGQTARERLAEQIANQASSAQQRVRQGASQGRTVTTPNVQDRFAAKPGLREVTGGSARDQLAERLAKAKPTRGGAAPAGGLGPVPTSPAGGYAGAPARPRSPIASATEGKVDPTTLRTLLEGVHQGVAGAALNELLQQLAQGRRRAVGRF